MQASARRFVFPFAALSATILCLAAAVPAQASLGQAKASVDADVTHFKARLKSTASTTYTVHELTGDGGGVTREYTNGSGVVFAVSWDGPARPDLQQLFGNYFARFQADVHSRARLHRAMRADDIDFVVRTGGHPGHMWGYALLPDQVPQGFSMEGLQ